MLCVLITITHRSNYSHTTNLSCRIMHVVYKILLSKKYVVLFYYIPKTNETSGKAHRNACADYPPHITMHLPHSYHPYIFPTTPTTIRTMPIYSTAHPILQHTQPSTIINHATSILCVTPKHDTLAKFDTCNNSEVSRRTQSHC